MSFTRLPRWTAPPISKYLWKVMIPICRPTAGDHHHSEGHRVLELLRVAPAHHRRSQSYFLVSNGIQEIRENGFGRENIPAMMAAVVAISVPLIVAVPDFPEENHGGRFREGA